jgi:hypothetical protein
MRGVTLIDAVVGSALVLLIFMALVGLLRSSLLVASLAKAKAGATAVANTQLEYIRGLDYDSVGTIGGIPAGAIPQYATTTQNGIPYAIRTFIEYADDPADGTGAADSNAITTDYKHIKVAVTYLLKGKLREVFMVSSYAPPSIETATNGGTLKIIVVSATGAPVPGATVQIVNASTSPVVNLTTFTDTTGVVLLGGAATSTQYQIFVSKGGYSSAQTYDRDATNQNPNPGYLTVVKNATTASTFAIDILSSLTLSTLYPIMATTTLDAFTDTSKLASQISTQVQGSSLMLQDIGAGYAASGSATSVSITPARLVSWQVASTTITSPNNTSVRIQVLDGSGGLIPDAQVPGNSAGFSATSIDLSGVSTSTYPTLALSATLTTTDASTTPALQNWSVTALVGPTPIPNVSVTLTGIKTIGSTGAGAAILKNILSASTNSSGVATFSAEWDSYSLDVAGYDTVDACYGPSYSLAPGGTMSQSLYLGAVTSNSLLISVRDTTGVAISNVTVTLSRTGYSSTSATSICGGAYFGGLTASSLYSVQISKSGYTTTTYTNVTVGGHTFYAASFP